MDLGLTRKVALVTGSSRGIGRGIALTLAAEGCDLMLTGRDGDALQDAARAAGRSGVSAHTHTADLRKPDAPAGLAEAVARAYGRLDVLVNNAGATKRGDFLALTDEDWQDGFALKLFAHVRLTRAVWPMLATSRGSVVTIAGSGARMPGAEFTIGGSVNAACVAFSKALSERGKADGVQVNVVSPGGATDTERFARRLAGYMQRTGHDEQTARTEYVKEMNITRLGTTDDIAGLVAFIVSPRGRWLHGEAIDMNGGEIPAI
jgi:3-oxoacyl-[acyl-carrier protein] reductase